jgi:hypothetical protein
MLRPPPLLSKVSFSYIFASRELPEFGGTDYNDAFFLNINGANLAKLANGKTVTINNLVADKANRATDDPACVREPSPPRRVATTRDALHRTGT